MFTRLRFILLAGAAGTLLFACTMDFSGFQFGSQLSSGGAGAGGGNGGTGGTPLLGGFGGTPVQGGMGGTPVQGGMGGTGGVVNMGGMGGVGGMGGMGGMLIVDVPCEVTPCDVSQGAVCCVDWATDMGSCNGNGNCGNSETEITCDKPSDCPGQICCAQFSAAQGEYTTVQCQNGCNGNGAVIVCDNNGDCGGNDTCAQSILLPMGYLVCN